VKIDLSTKASEAVQKGEVDLEILEEDPAETMLIVPQDPCMSELVQRASSSGTPKHKPKQQCSPTSAVADSSGTIAKSKAKVVVVTKSQPVGKRALPRKQQGGQAK
jgi:hypothetical protein